MVRTGNEKLKKELLLLPAAKGATLTEGTIAALNGTGYAEPASKKEGLIIAGVVQRLCENTGEDGDNQVLVKRGAFVFENDGTVKTTDLLKKCYIKDEVTVSMTAEGSSIAGIILAVESDGVTVDVGQYIETVTVTQGQA